MALTSAINSDSGANTMTLSISSGSTVIENVTYTFSSNSLVFQTIGAFQLSASDFIAFTTILDSFNNAIAVSCFPSYYMSSTFSINNVSDQNDGVNTLTFNFQKANHPLYTITATYPSGQVSFAKRNQSTTLLFDEWQYFHQVSSHFEGEIHKFYNV